MLYIYDVIVIKIIIERIIYSMSQSNTSLLTIGKFSDECSNWELIKDLEPKTPQGSKGVDSSHQMTRI